MADVWNIFWCCSHIKEILWYIFCVVLLCVFTLWAPCCDVRYDFYIKTMFGSSTSNCWYEGSCLIYVICVYLHTHIVFLCVVYPMLLVLWIVHSWLPLRYSLMFNFVLNTYVLRSTSNVCTFGLSPCLSGFCQKNNDS